MIIGETPNIEFTRLCMDAIKEALEVGITPNYLFIEEALLTEGKPAEFEFSITGQKTWRQPIAFSGLKIWFTKLPEGKMVVAVNIKTSTPEEAS